MSILPAFSSILLLLLSCRLLQSAQAAVSCESDAFCSDIFRPGSQCVQGECTNPFYNGGCLKSLLPETWHKIRVCGSEDPPEAEAMGYCRRSPFQDYYPEVRLGIQNWESSYMLNWIFQILFAEVLEVPVSVELGKPGTNADFYNVHSAWDWGAATNIDALRTSHEVKDCRLFDRDDATAKRRLAGLEDPPDPTKGCANMLGEIWKNSYLDIIRTLEEDGIILRPTSLGVIAKEDFVIPQRTASIFPELAIFHGLQGDQNRQKLAGIFKTPTTWLEYCQHVSPNTCTSANDTVAVRPPEDEDEGAKYFVEGLYTGFFRTTEANNCTLNPECAGIFIDYPCEWSLNTVQKLVWLDIPLQPVQFSYSELLQINSAANATNAHFIGAWWKPDPLHELWFGTDSQLIQVYLPPATQECLDHRNDISTRCLHDNPVLEAGSPLGACEEPANPIHKVVATALQELGQDPTLDPALWSPAHLLAERFEITDLQYSEIFDKWLQRGTDKWNFDLRDAACEWVGENLDLMTSFLPPTYPRVIQEQQVAGSGPQVAAMIVALGAILLVVLAGIATYRRRNTKVLYHAQLGIVSANLGGLLLVAIGAFLLTLYPPTDGLCVAPLWFVNLGYVIELLPIIVKVDAIHNNVRTGKAMKRVRLEPKTIWQSIVVGCAVIGSILVAWTVIDPPVARRSYELSDEVNSHGETLVLAVQHCQSDTHLWNMFMLVWKGAILLYGLVVAFLASREKNLNGTKNIAAFLCGHAVLLAFRTAFYGMRESQNQAYLRQYASLLLSLDCIVAVVVFAGPKLVRYSELKDSGEQMPDLFLETTIVMADVVGFTKWASMREPADVFRLLEQLFSQFDRIAEKRRILKVETVGDCYVGAAGIPNPQRDHAVNAARFALDCMSCMQKITSSLEVAFGPDTSELSLRIGMNSGAVTGGFLRGKGARFQVFGDTYNTASRLENYGEPGKIHISEACADRLRKAGKGRWIRKRDDKVVYAKGGKVHSYWLVHGRRMGFATQISGMMISENGSQNEGLDSSPGNQKERLVKWNVEVLLDALKEIVACQVPSGPRLRRTSTKDIPTITISEIEEQSTSPSMPLDEVREIIYLPDFNRRAANRKADVEAVVVPELVVQQLTTLVGAIASLYNDNHFHNFGHASHVVMAVTKYLSRIRAPVELEKGTSAERAAKQHDHTYGITSDPLTQFAIIFSALIHDLDHPGVPNTQLIVENEGLGKKYQDRSVAEQNSFDLAWNLLQQDRFNDLRRTICPNESELERFRQLVINAVMATDLGDKELKTLRNNRWEKAFAAKDSTECEPLHAAAASAIVEASEVKESRQAVVNRKATIVIEHLIQAADIAHTCQHWHVYRQWNHNLFKEMYAAYKMGRADKNPVDFWYEGEIGFFDFYIIPLSEKLRDCGVFGVSSDENLSYATANREEWVARGREVVKEYLEEMEEDDETETCFEDDEAEQYPFRVEYEALVRP